MRHPSGYAVGTLAPTGFTQTVYVFPTRLVWQQETELFAKEGDSRSHIGGIRRELAKALGIGDGVTAAEVGAEGSRRGRIMEITPEIAKLLGFTHAIVLTQHAFSARKRQQILAPVLPGSWRFAGDDDVKVTNEPWLAAAGISGESAVIALSLIVTLNQHEGDIARECPEVIQEDPTMRAIDAALIRRFELRVAPPVTDAPVAMADGGRGRASARADG